MDRIGTGNSNLDRILGGGLPKNSINLVTGLPGSGKTILAQQLAFANAHAERPVLFVSTVSEPLPKMMTYLQELSFADVNRIGSEVVYASLIEPLVENGESLTEYFQKLIMQHRPRVIIIDSFKAVADLIPESKWRTTVFELAGLLSAYDSTSIWIGEYPPDTQSLTTVEFAVADGIIELHRSQTGSRDDRYLRVAKLRGSNFRDGTHAFTISQEGLHIFPRLVSPTLPEDYQPIQERLHTGIPGLDGMIEQGWLRGTSTLVLGPSGAGKTMIGLHFLRKGAENGEAGLLLSFQENPTQIKRSVESFGWNTDELLRPGGLDILYTSPIELHIDTIVQELLRRVEQSNVQRIVVDAVGDIARSARDLERFSDYLYALKQTFAARNITAMFVHEEKSENAMVRQGLTQVSYMSDNLLRLQMDLGEDMNRTIRVTKSRGSAHDKRRRVLDITSEGVVVR